MNSALLWFAVRITTLYPAAFRARYREQVLQTASDACAARAARGTVSLIFAARMFADLSYSTLQEHARMLRHRLAARPFFYQALGLSAIAFFMALAGYTVMQQTIRRAANHPQREMALDAAAAIRSGADPATVVVPRGIDFARSLEPFLIVYSDDGRVIASEAKFAYGLPTPPPGVLLSARRHDRNELTWQPRRDVRLAITVLYVDGPHSAYVLAARSLWTAEQGELIARYAALGGWLFTVALLMLSAFLFARLQPRQGAPA